MRVRLDLAYDGSGFSGWQLQPGRDTVQGRVEEALRRLYRRDAGERIPVVCAGRTDAGVHAEQQVAHFDAPLAIPCHGVRVGANHLLPASIRVLAAREAAAGFHARHDAVAKTYRYYLLPAAPVSPLRARYAWAVGPRLGREAMEAAARAFVGRHDFRAFFAAPAGEQPESPQRTVTAARVFDEDGFLVFEVTADGFWRYMVRRMAGTLVAVGHGRLPAERVGELLADPETPGPRFRAPASGLRLWRVRYRGENGFRDRPSCWQSVDETGRAPRPARRPADKARIGRHTGRIPTDSQRRAKRSAGMSSPVECRPALSTDC